MDLDIGAVRAFVVVVDRAHFGDAALDLGITQQAISKRIGKLESSLGARLLQRGASGATPTAAGRTFVSEARAVLAAVDRASSCLRSRRPLRVDVLRTRLAPAGLLQEFHQQNPDVDLEVVTSDGLRSAVPGLRENRIDAAFARPRATLPGTIRIVPGHLDRLTLAVGRHHEFAGRTHLAPRDLAGRTVWMPGNTPGSEWADFYDALAQQFDIVIDTRGPNFGLEFLLDELAGSSDKASFLGPGIKAPMRGDVTQIPIADPALVYPFALLWDERFEHRSLSRLRAWLGERLAASRPDSLWVPEHDRRWLALDMVRIPAADVV